MKKKILIHSKGRYVKFIGKFYTVFMYKVRLIGKTFSLNIFCILY